MTDAPLCCLLCGEIYGYDRIVPHAPGCANDRSSGVLWADCIHVEIEPPTPEEKAVNMSPTIRVTTARRVEDRHLGDGVYASHDGYQIWLAANDHRNRVIAIDQGVMANLIDYARKIGLIE